VEQGVAFNATFAGAANGACLDEFTRSVRTLGLEERVRFIGPAYGDQKDELFRTHDVFVLPTFYAQEAFPLVVLEAMQWGLPVVSTTEGAIPEIVQDGVTGYVVPQRDPAALAARLATLLGSDELMRGMGLNARKRFLARYTLEHFETRLTAALVRSLAL
jgi:glycosyltransferase involved in cell wall biosynthesis